MFCRIYLSGKIFQPKELLISLCKLLQTEIIDERYIKTNEYSAEIRSNDEFDEIRQKEFPNGFLCFPFCIEIEFKDDVSNSFAAEKAGRVLTYLWENKYTAIASCDFEDQLPEEGGYKSKKVPWF